MSLPAPLGDEGQVGLFIPMGEVSTSQETYCYVLTAGTNSRPRCVNCRCSLAYSSVSHIVWRFRGVRGTVAFYDPRLTGHDDDVVDRTRGVREDRC